MDKISYDDFKKIEVRVGTIRTAEKIPDTDKLLRLTVEFGDGEIRQIVSGIAAYYPDPQELVGKQSPFVYNLEPRTIRGFESNGMIFGIGGEVGFVRLMPEKEVPPGSQAG
jgi:methionyl-tRNA synthetase